VRNDVQLYDLRLEKDQTVPMPEIPEGWHYWFYVFTGEVKAGNLSFAEGESGLVTLSVPVSFKAQTDTTLVLFMMNPEASVVKLGTVGH
jgi:redox-sensitive bicupin YhaK (pirin superfamily)